MIKPILFNTDMVRAILDNRKTVTRRVVKPQPRMVYYDGELQDSGDNVRDGVPLWVLIAEGQNGVLEQIVPPYHPGDILYVRETFCPFDADHVISGVKYAYKADATPESERARQEYGYKWHPSIHMPREAARIFLRVTDMRAERLRDSFFKYGNTIFYLQREGIDIGEHCRECIDTYGSPICNDRESECGVLDEVRGGFSDLWDSTIKPADHALYGWYANPWVWVISFERIGKEEAVS